MNYQRIYNKFISHALSENRKKYKKTDSRYICYERHHIIPKCLGGNNSKENFVLLTPEEHLLLHLCLVRIYPNNHSLIKAAMLMGTDRYGNRVNNKQYGWIRKACSSALSPSKDKPSKRKGRTFGSNSAKGKPNGKKGIPKVKSAWNKGLTSPLKGILRGPQMRVICTNCGLEGGISNMKKYHFENCKR